MIGTRAVWTAAIYSVDAAWPHGRSVQPPTAGVAIAELTWISRLPGVLHRAEDEALTSGIAVASVSFQAQDVLELCLLLRAFCNIAILFNVLFLFPSGPAAAGVA